MNNEISMELLGAACDAIQDSQRALNLKAYADSITKQLLVERAQRQGNAALIQNWQQNQYLGMGNAWAGQQLLGNPQPGRGGNWQ